ncbi:hypothetical protein [Thermomonas hydrothermalis]|uniref:Uncharacterized protein n=1 Tax=Thermomonas hydrothermalis TaxID=213588 RepID=A0A1M5AKA0_9GAMM|nr:hypothetical protein [Thermomonas hydrothermalis]MCL6618312.1 hypothetical protein [Thermomonas hydrothermalis]SHF30595.1 hypothetical protein SAMN02745204_02230 [Thermomonas hydrothermalis]
MRKFVAPLFAFAVAVSAPAFAQQQNDSIVLQLNAGSAMTSRGGDFMTANSGQPVAAGDKVMVNAGSAVTLVYKNGCKMELRQPGVYTVPADCKVAGWANNGGVSGANAAIIAGVAALGAAVLTNEKDAPVGPLSASIRHF